MFLDYNVTLVPDMRGSVIALFVWFKGITSDIYLINRVSVFQQYAVNLHKLFFIEYYY